MSSEQQDDPNRWNAEQRVAFLVARGIEDAVSSCTDEEQRALIMSFLDTDKVDASPDDNDGGGVWRTTGSPEEVPGERGAGSTEEDLDGGLEEVLSSFCAITACDRAQGKCMLEAMGWDLDTAVMMYMDEGDNTATRGSSAENNALRESLPVGSSSSSALSAAAAAAASLSSSPPYPPRRYDAGNHSIYNQFDYPQLDAARNQWGDDDDGDNDNGNGRRYDNYDEAGVRMPDPIRQQRLLGPSSGGLNGAGMGGMMMGGEVYDSLSRAEEPNVDWLFPPPRHLSFPGTYKDARELARQDKKWLLINIQNHEVFESHMLNRDTWANETVEALLRNSFIFWQRGSTSVDARSYMLLHNVADKQLPHIAVVDARTGSKIHVMKGFIPPEDFSITIMEFVEANDLTRGSVAKVIKPGSGGKASRSDSLGSDAKLEGASRYSGTTAVPLGMTAPGSGHDVAASSMTPPAVYRSGLEGPPAGGVDVDSSISSAPAPTVLTKEEMREKRLAALGGTK